MITHGADDQKRCIKELGKNLRSGVRKGRSRALADLGSTKVRSEKGCYQQVSCDKGLSGGREFSCQVSGVSWSEDFGSPLAFLTSAQAQRAGCRRLPLSLPPKGKANQAAGLSPFSLRAPLQLWMESTSGRRGRAAPPLPGRGRCCTAPGAGGRWGVPGGGQGGSRDLLRANPLGTETPRRERPSAGGAEARRYRTRRGVSAAGPRGGGTDWLGSAER